MKPSIKFSMILFVILIIGIAIGFEISEISIKNRFDRPGNFRRPDGFLKIFGEIIKPDSGQKPVVDSILLKHHMKIDQIVSSSFLEVSKQMDSLKTAMIKILTKEQMGRLEKEMNRMKRPPPPGGMPMREGPPPGDMRMREPQPGEMKREPPPGEMRKESTDDAGKRDDQQRKP